MATKTMTVTGLVIQSTNTYQLRGNGELVSITVTKDPDGSPPAEGKASGSASSTSTSANVSEASLTVWNEMHARLARFPFLAIVEFNASTKKVSDLIFGSVTSAMASRRKVAEDVAALRFLAERLAEKFVPEVFCEDEHSTGVRSGLKERMQQM